MAGFVFVETGGSPREIGFDIGRASAEHVRHLVRTNPEFYGKETGRSYQFLVRHFMRHFLPYARRYSPDYVEEIAGIAEGSGLPFEDVAVFSAEEEILDTWGGWDKCTSAAVRDRDRLVLMHNEDYVCRYHGRMVVIKAEPRRGPAFLSMAYPGTLAGSACSLNSFGVAVSNNSLRFRPRRRGLPKNFVLRRLVEANGVAWARAAVKRAVPRAVSGSVNIVSAREGRAMFVESAPKCVVTMHLESAPFFVHANHVISPGIERRGEDPRPNSLVRQEAMERLLRRRNGRFGIAALKRILGSVTAGIRRCGIRESDPTTLASIVIDPSHRVMHACDRHLATGRWRAFRL
jgi:isopenicillin-N N-acyltransferase-like protein